MHIIAILIIVLACSASSEMNSKRRKQTANYPHGFYDCSSDPWAIGRLDQLIIPNTSLRSNDTITFFLDGYMDSVNAASDVTVQV
jgi:hypothetical protein